MATTSWGQRKSLGRRYSIDPALLMEQERLEREYALMPGREQRALSERQFQQAQAQQASQFSSAQKNQAQAGMMQTGTNLLTTGMLVNALYNKGGADTGISKAGWNNALANETRANAFDKARGALPSEPSYAPTSNYPTTYEPGFTYQQPSYQQPTLGGYDPFVVTPALETGSTEVAGMGAGGAQMAAERAATEAGAQTAASQAAMQRGGTGWGSYAEGGLYEAGGRLAAGYGGRILERNAPTTFQERMGRTISDAESGYKGIGQPWAKEILGKDEYEKVEPVFDVLNPGGKAYEEIVAPVIKKACCFIFITAYDDLLPIVRRYRDEHMTDTNRRGYYRIADKIVPLMAKSKVFKWIVRLFMTGPMVSYGKYFYGEGSVGLIFKPVTKLWLNVFQFLGKKKPYIRSNGEEV